MRSHLRDVGRVDHADYVDHLDHADDVGRVDDTYHVDHLDHTMLYMDTGGRCTILEWRSAETVDTCHIDPLYSLLCPSQGYGREDKPGQRRGGERNGEGLPCVQARAADRYHPEVVIRVQSVPRAVFRIKS